MSMREYDPWGEMLSLREAMNRLLEDSFVAAGVRGGHGALQMPLDVYETRDAVVVRTSVPGVRPEDMDVTVTGNTLTIRGELRDQAPAEEVRYHHREHRSGTFGRSIPLPVEVQSDRVEATCEHGVLTLTLPKAERMRPKSIRINAGRGATPVQAQSGGSRAAIEGRVAETAPATDEASATGSGMHTGATSAMQAAAAAGPSDETAGTSGGASHAGQAQRSSRSHGS